MRMYTVWRPRCLRRRARMLWRRLEGMEVFSLVQDLV